MQHSFLLESDDNGSTLITHRKRFHPCRERMHPLAVLMPAETLRAMWENSMKAALYLDDGFSAHMSCHLLPVAVVEGQRLHKQAVLLLTPCLPLA
jgi:hypothetical protein